jgi:hypothetical protein
MHTNLTPQAAVTKLRYGIQQEPDGRWVIVNARDDTLIWTGKGHWAERESAHPIHFASPTDAEEFAQHVFK